MGKDGSGGGGFDPGGGDDGVDLTASSDSSGVGGGGDGGFGGSFEGGSGLGAGPEGFGGGGDGVDLTQSSDSSGVGGGGPDLTQSSDSSGGVGGVGGGGGGVVDLTQSSDSSAVGGGGPAVGGPSVGGAGGGAPDVSGAGTGVDVTGALNGDLARQLMANLGGNQFGGSIDAATGAGLGSLGFDNITGLATQAGVIGGSLGAAVSPAGGGATPGAPIAPSDAAATGATGALDVLGGDILGQQAPRPSSGPADTWAGAAQGAPPPDLGAGPGSADWTNMLYGGDPNAPPQGSGLADQATGEALTGPGSPGWAQALGVTAATGPDGTISGPDFYNAIYGTEPRLGDPLTDWMDLGLVTPAEAGKLTVRPGSSDQTLPTAANNPGGMNLGSAARQYGATDYYVGSINPKTGEENRTAVFGTPETGAAAQFSLLEQYANAGITPQQLAQKWSGGTGGQANVDAYARAIASAAGIGVNDRVTSDMMFGPAGMNMARAQAVTREGFSGSALSTEGWQNAQDQARIFGGYDTGTPNYSRAAASSPGTADVMSSQSNAPLTDTSSDAASDFNPGPATTLRSADLLRLETAMSGGGYPNTVGGFDTPPTMNITGAVPPEAIRDPPPPGGSAEFDQPPEFGESPPAPIPGGLGFQQPTPAEQDSLVPGTASAPLRMAGLPGAPGLTPNVGADATPVVTSTIPGGGSAPGMPGTPAAVPSGTAPAPESGPPPGWPPDDLLPGAVPAAPAGPSVPAAAVAGNLGEVAPRDGGFDRGSSPLLPIPAGTAAAALGTAAPLTLSSSQQQQVQQVQALQQSLTNQFYQQLLNQGINVNDPTIQAQVQAQVLAQMQQQGINVSLYQQWLQAA